MDKTLIEPFGSWNALLLSGANSNSPTSRPAPPAPRRRSDTEHLHWPRPSAVRFERARGRLVARPGRQPGCHDSVREATFAVSASVDGLHATRAPAELAMISPPPDTGAAWQIGDLYRLSADTRARGLAAPWLTSSKPSAVRATGRSARGGPSGRGPADRARTHWPGHIRPIAGTEEFDSVPPDPEAHRATSALFAAV